MFWNRQNVVSYKALAMCLPLSKLEENAMSSLMLLQGQFVATELKQIWQKAIIGDTGSIQRD
jgi:hypothetical protein